MYVSIYTAIQSKVTLNTVVTCSWGGNGPGFMLLAEVYTCAYRDNNAHIQRCEAEVQGSFLNKLSVWMNSKKQSECEILSILPVLNVL